MFSKCSPDVERSDQKIKELRQIAAPILNRTRRFFFIFSLKSFAISSKMYNFAHELNTYRPINNQILIYDRKKKPIHATYGDSHDGDDPANNAGR